MAATLAPAPRPTDDASDDAEDRNELPDPVDPLAPGNEVTEADPPPRDASDLPTMSREVEHELVTDVMDLFQRARDRRRHIVNAWRTFYAATHDRHWSLHRASYMPKVEVPEIFPILDALVAWMTDKAPTFDAAPLVDPLNPWYETMARLADDLTTTMKATWQVDKIDRDIEMLAWDGLIYGVGYLKTTWDRSAFKGYGNAVMRRVDPFAIYPDPDATSDHDLNYIIEARTISAQELERRFPGSLDRINDNLFTLDVDRQPTKIDQSSRDQPAKANPGAMSPSTSPSYGLPGQGRVSVTDDPGVTLLEAWLRVPCEDPESDDQAPYDCWRYVAVASNRVVFDSMADDMWSHGRHPYDRYVPMETGEWYGKSMVEMLMPAQRSINRILAATEHNIDLMGNPIMVDDSRSGISRTKVTNKPGERLTTNPGSSPQWLTPPQMHPQISSDLVRFLIGEMERISGLSAVVRGASPTGRNAQGVIDAVQEAAFVRIRKMLRNLGMVIGAGGEKAASMIVEFYDAPRIVQLVGPEGDKTALMLRNNHFYDPSSQGRVPGRFQILIDAGDSLNVSRGQRIAEADALYAMGAIDIEAVLEVHDFPNWYRVVDRVREQQAAQGTLGAPPTQRAAARR